MNLRARSERGTPITSKLLRSVHLFTRNGDNGLNSGADLANRLPSPYVRSSPHAIRTKSTVTERPVELPSGGKGLVSWSQQSNIVRKRPNARKG